MFRKACSLEVALLELVWLFCATLSLDDMNLPMRRLFFSVIALVMTLVARTCEVQSWQCRGSFRKCRGSVVGMFAHPSPRVLAEGRDRLIHEGVHVLIEG